MADWIDEPFTSTTLSALEADTGAKSAPGADSKLAATEVPTMASNQDPRLSAPKTPTHPAFTDAGHKTMSPLEFTPSLDPDKLPDDGFSEASLRHLRAAEENVADDAELKSIRASLAAHHRYSDVLKGRLAEEKHEHSEKWGCICCSPESLERMRRSNERRVRRKEKAAKGEEPKKGDRPKRPEKIEDYRRVPKAGERGLGSSKGTKAAICDDEADDNDEEVADADDSPARRNKFASTIKPQSEKGDANAIDDITSARFSENSLRATGAPAPARTSPTPTASKGRKLSDTEAEEEKKVKRAKASKGGKSPGFVFEERSLRME